MDEIKIIFSNHESESINNSNVRCYAETFIKELRNGAKAGYRLISSKRAQIMSIN